MSLATKYSWRRRLNNIQDNAAQGNRKAREAISIVIPAFNEADYIENTLSSVFACSETYLGAIEVIVVDNNSTDATAYIARKCGAQVVFEPINQIARARNTGAKAASGKFLIFLDADTTIHGDILDN